MSGQQINQNDDTVCLDVQLPTPIIAAPEKVWAVMLDKVHHTEKYLPATNVKTTDIVPGKQAYREMVLDGKQMQDNIYFDKSRYEIRYIAVGQDDVRINLFDPDTGFLEYWKENGKGQRIPWDGPTERALAAMQKTKELAEAST